MKTYLIAFLVLLGACTSMPLDVPTTSPTPPSTTAKPWDQIADGLKSGPMDDPVGISPIVEQALEKSVVIFTPEGSKGSGTVVSEDGMILTAGHVVDGANEAKVGFANSKKLYDAKVVWINKRYDLALIKINPKDRALKVAKLSHDPVKLGDHVFSIGNPLGGYFKFVSGSVSGRSRGEMGEPMIQVDLTVLPGQSGSAIFNERGELIGVLVQLLMFQNSVTGYGFAVPVSTLCSLVFCPSSV